MTPSTFDPNAKPPASAAPSAMPSTRVAMTQVSAFRIPMPDMPMEAEKKSVKQAVPSTYFQPEVPFKSQGNVPMPPSTFSR